MKLIKWWSAHSYYHLLCLFILMHELLFCKHVVPMGPSFTSVTVALCRKYHFCFCLLTETSSCSLRQYLHAFKGLGSAATLQDAGADSVDRNYETFKWSDGRFIANCPHHFGPLSMSLETQETGLCCLFLIYLLLIQMCTQP